LGVSQAPSSIPLLDEAYGESCDRTAFAAMTLVTALTFIDMAYSGMS